MVEYNTQLPRIEMREYGRHIQKLIDHCVSIPDKEERTRCAHAIAERMSQLFPELNSDNKNQNRIVWDHMNIISNFKLNIEYPCEVLDEKELRPTPSKVPYPRKSEKYRVYGTHLKDMIRKISEMEGGVEKDRNIFLVANQMKKLLITENPDIATDQRVFKDIKEISGGEIDIDLENYRLNEYIGILSPQEKKKKKK